MLLKVTYILFYNLYFPTKKILSSKFIVVGSEVLPKCNIFISMIYSFKMKAGFIFRIVETPLNLFAKWNLCLSIALLLLSYRTHSLNNIHTDINLCSLKLENGEWLTFRNDAWNTIKVGSLPNLYESFFHTLTRSVLDKNSLTHNTQYLSWTSMECPFIYISGNTCIM